MSDRVLLPHTSDHFLVMHRNLDGVVPNPLLVSAGVDEWHDYTFMHADYFAANQPVFNNGLLDLRLRDAPDSVTFAGPIRGGRRHADYFAANQAVFQPVFNEALLDDCIMNLPDWVTEADQPAKRG